MSAGEITITTRDGTVLSNNSTLIVDQTLHLNITFSGGEKEFTKNDKVSIIYEGDWITIPNGKDLPVIIDPSDRKKASVNNIQVNIKSGAYTEQSITIETTNSDYSSRPFKYKIKDIEDESLTLIIDKFYMKTPITQNNPGQDNKNRTMVSTVVKDGKGNGIPNLSVTISSDDKGSLSQLALMDNTWKTLEITNDSDDYEQFKLTTDENGGLVFYAFPQLLRSVTLTFFSKAEGLDSTLQSYPLFVLNEEVDNNGNNLRSPMILESEGGNLSPQKDEKLFHIKIPSYHHAEISDYILFFVNGVQSGLYTKLSKLTNLNSYVYTLPYSIFPLLTKSKFSYAIAKLSANSQFSNKLLVKYHGGSENKPNTDINRKFVLPDIYSSAGIDPYNIIKNGHLINYDEISNYIKNNDGATIYLVIEADSTDINKVNPGDDIHINIYINSSNKTPINVPYRLTIPKAEQGNSSQGILPLPISLIGNNDSYTTGKYGTIYFEYYKVDGEKKIYSQYWGGYIDTVLPGQFND
ncbi:hypothetical protein [Xenorhabdus bharatensis]|uniref:hypothetical protein n=1 Tax=Xenorhabdus bharatensis TaxID=3136256 RepID=UPI0030F3C972